MTFLPIVQRELRAATRKRATYWLRGLTVFVAIAVAFYMLMTVGQWAGPARAAANLFTTLTRVAYFCCLVTGVFLTADCLSEEKREGTLGLLFLTDLKGYDVVLGKLAVTSLNAFYALLGIFPVLAVPLLLGGVTFGEVCRVMLALVNTLIFSLAGGMFISSISWREQRAMMAAASLLFFAGIILPAMGGPYEWLSPRLAFRQAASANFSAQPQLFGWGLLIIQGLSWGLLWSASRRVPRSWQLEPIPVETLGVNMPQYTPPPEARRGSEALELGTRNSELGPAAPGAERGQTRRSELEARDAQPGTEWASVQTSRRELLERNPMEWLASRNRSNAWVWGSLALLAFGWFMVCLEQSRGASISSLVESFFMALTLHGLLKFWIAWEAGRRFYEPRRDGTLESLLSTPLSLAEIMRGQIRSLFHQFFGPICALFVVDFILMSWLGSSALFNPFSSTEIWIFFAMMGMLLADAYALAWLGLWLGFKAKKSWTAAFGALARILLLPTCIFLAMVGALGSRGGFKGASPAVLIFVWLAVGVINSWLFGAHAHRKLHHEFRETATEEAEPGPVSILPPPQEAPELEEYFSLFKK